MAHHDLLRTSQAQSSKRLIKWSLVVPDRGPVRWPINSPLISRKASQKDKKSSKSSFRSRVLRVMSSARSRCANLLIDDMLMRWMS